MLKKNPEEPVALVTYPSLPDLIEAKKKGPQEFAKTRAAYEGSQGKILEEYYALNFSAAILLVETKEQAGADGGAERNVLKMRLYYNARQSTPEVDDVFRSARRVERKYSVLLVGKTQQILVRGIHATAVVLLSVLDAMVGSPDKPKRMPVAAASAQKEIRQIEQNARDVALDRALLRYIAGLAAGFVLAVGAVIILKLFVPIKAEIGATLIICLMSGAIGAILSVMIRMANREKLSVGLAQGRFVVILSGGFRLIIGAVFGTAMFVLVKAGLVPFGIPDSAEKVNFFFAGLAFLAGFSERWAQDTIVRTLPGAAGQNAVVPAPGKDG